MSPTPEHSDDRPAPVPRFGPPTTANPFWRLVIVSGALFCLSCLLWITAGFANQEAPGNQWLNRNGLMLIVITGCASIAAAIIAMVVDRSQTQRMKDASEANDLSSPAETRPEEPTS